MASSSVAVQFAQARDHFEKGEMQPAVAICQQILQTEESFSPAYALMSELWYQIGNIESAEKFLGLAQKFDDRNVGYILRKAQMLGIQEHWAEADQEISRAMMIDPHYAPTYTLMGDAKVNTQQYTEAMHFYEKSMALEDSAEIRERIAHCYVVQNQFSQAREALAELTARYPASAQPWLLLGDLQRNNQQFDEADHSYDQAIKYNASACEAWIGKGLIAHERKDEKLAPICFDKAIDANPNNPRTYYLLGGILLDRKNYEAALKFLHKALELKPNFVDARRKLAITLFSMRKKEETLEQIELVLQHDPHDEKLLFIRSTLLGEHVETAPHQHVSELFDVYADNFDDHLVKILEYKTPTFIKELFFKVLQETGNTRTDFSLLDIGCGTGLAAEALKDITDYRVGVDLSPKMVETARAKNLYQELAAEDALGFIARSERLFDVMVAADVLVYIGNPAPLFKEAYAKLSPQGYLIFSTENGDDVAPFGLRSSARFAHAKNAVIEAGAQFGFTLAAHMASMIRTESKNPIQGDIFVFQR
jgi:predicted TPR repeat methyltransferase/Tfp pilus assembly protein PilF